MAIAKNPIVFSDYFKIDKTLLKQQNIFDPVTKSIIVKDKIIASYIKEAELFIEQGKYLESVLASRDAFENALFNKIQSIGFKISSVPAIIKEQNNEYVKYFFESITDQLLTVQLGLNITKYYKFTRYMEYIPLDKSKGRNSARVLMREWDVTDAQFCLNYVFDEILHWQYENEIAIGETYAFDRNRTSNYKINEYNLENRYGGCFYIFSSQDLMELMYIQDENFNDFNNLSIGDKVKYNKESFENGVLVYSEEKMIEVLGYTKKIVTNNPPRWEVVIWYKDIPLSVKKKIFKAEKCIREYINLNKMNPEDLVLLNEDLFDSEIALNICNYISAIGSIKSISDLEKINNITKDQIDCIGRNTFI